MKNIILLLTALIFSSCAGDSSECIKVVYDNAFACQMEDMIAMKSTLDDEGPVYNTTVQFSEKLFAEYDLTYDVEDADVINEELDKAEVEVTLVTRKRNGPSFKDNKITAIYFLVKKKGLWMINDIKVIDREYL